MQTVVLLLHVLQKYNINQTTLKILSLFRSNYQASFHLREIARRTHVDVTAITAQLNRLENANVLASTLKGKNKEYSLNLHNYLGLYHIVLAETFTTIEYLGRNFEIKKLVSETVGSLSDSAFLFGSFAKEEMTRESDIDILIIADKKPELNAFKEEGNLIGRRISAKSVSAAQFSSGLMRKDPLILEVVANHIILKGIDNICGLMWQYYARR